MALDGVQFEITPEPTETEREAIVEAVRHVADAGRDGRPGPWWSAGLPGGDEDPAEG